VHPFVFVRGRLPQLVRYCSASAVSTVTSLVVLGILVGEFGMSAGWSNVIATGVGVVPSFELNRRWVWQRRGRRSLWTEVGPFAAFSFLGLAVSTLAVSTTAGWARSRGWTPAGRTFLAETANLAAFGTLWVIQFALLDRVLFRSRTCRPPGGPRQWSGSRFPLVLLVELLASRRGNRPSSDGKLYEKSKTLREQPGSCARGELIYTEK
jgi:putative flippase GtrA